MKFNSTCSACPSHTCARTFPNFFAEDPEASKIERRFWSLTLSVDHQIETKRVNDRDDYAIVVDSFQQADDALDRAMGLGTRHWLCCVNSIALRDILCIRGKRDSMESENASVVQRLAVQRFIRNADEFASASAPFALTSARF